MAASVGRVDADADPAAGSGAEPAAPSDEGSAPAGRPPKAQRTEPAAPGRAEPASPADGASAPPSVADLLRRFRFEILQLDGIEEQVRQYVPTDVKVTVTASPRKGLEATLDLSERLAGAGYAVVPHLSARLVRDRAHLEEVLARLQRAGITELFVPAGDATEPGEYHSAADLLAAMGDARTQFERIGITGYPESHHMISDEETIRAMFAKAEMATDIISQLCFDAQTIDGWIKNVRERGTHLPIWIGMPGCVDYAKLVRITMKIGMGESTRFLRHNRNRLARVLTRQFKPDRLLRDLTPVVTDPAAKVAGFHIYTFNEVARTERWRQRALTRLAQR
jgi:methylenetetrahydrofolate reductase (NADPH)